MVSGVLVAKITSPRNATARRVAIHAKRANATIRCPNDIVLS